MNRPTPEKMREHIDAFVEAALQAADPEAAVARALLDAPLWDSAGPPPAPGMAPDSPVRLLSVGKVALSMARGARSILDRRIVDAVIVHPRGLEAADGWPASVRTIAASHPLPDQGSVEAAREAVALATRVLPDETLLVLLSGGGSSLLAMPREGISLDDLRGVNDALLRAGADIEQLNAVRRALSKIKGGRLGRMVAAATRKVVLVLSD
ncbi:MAG: DUF4147 domain-containing protein, partial [Candidatus Eisenbacteria bacterium]|nr:DUF4147 domain-containing protein [Candidatus Eisenbacteria bacterium]